MLYGGESPWVVSSRLAFGRGGFWLRFITTGGLLARVNVRLLIESLINKAATVVTAYDDPPRGGGGACV